MIVRVANDGAKACHRNSKRFSEKKSVIQSKIKICFEQMIRMLSHGITNGK